jgi:hypothetical protein
MLIRVLKRLTVWLFETSFEAFLLWFLLLLVFTYGSERIYGRDVWSGLVAISGVLGVFMAEFGYLLTTGVVRAFWTNRTPWLHPTISVVLFSIHLQIFFLVSGDLYPFERLWINAGGACIVFACTFAGGYLLRRWEKPAMKEMTARTSHEVPE